MKGRFTPSISHIHMGSLRNEKLNDTSGFSARCIMQWSLLHFVPCIHIRYARQQRRNTRIILCSLTGQMQRRFAQIIQHIRIHTHCNKKIYHIRTLGTCRQMQRRIAFPITRKIPICMLQQQSRAAYIITCHGYMQGCLQQIVTRIRIGARLEQGFTQGLTALTRRSVQRRFKIFAPGKIRICPAR